MKGWHGNRYGHSLASRGVRTTPFKRSGRLFNTKTFQVGNWEVIVCRSEKTSRGFRHVAEFYIGDNLVGTTSVNYLNRTWEKYEFETVIKNLLYDMKIPETKRNDIMEKVENESIGGMKENMKSIAMVSSLGDLFGKTEKEKNDWKLRMIRAGMGEGIQLPDDWDELSEEEKGRRLDKIIEFMKGE